MAQITKYSNPLVPSKLRIIDGPISPHALVKGITLQNATGSTAGGKPKRRLKQIEISTSLFIAVIGGQLQVPAL